MTSAQELGLLDVACRGYANLGVLYSTVEPKRAIDVFGSLFARSVSPSDVPLLGMATGESLACLNHLVQRGEVTCEPAADGVAWYRMRAGAGPDATAAPRA